MRLNNPADMSEQQINRELLIGIPAMNRRQRRKMAKEIRTLARRGDQDGIAYAARQKRDAQRAIDHRAMRVLQGSVEQVPSIHIPRKKTWRESLKGLIGR